MILRAAAILCCLALPLRAETVADQAARASEALVKSVDRKSVV
jgi:hypothetical protein